MVPDCECHECALYQLLYSQLRPMQVMRSSKARGPWTMHVGCIQGLPVQIGYLACTYSVALQPCSPELAGLGPSVPASC
jgi:hypothetical protein